MNTRPAHRSEEPVIFGKKDTMQEELRKADGEAISAIIDKTMTIKGEISFQGKTKIEGTVNGDIAVSTWC